MGVKYKVMLSKRVLKRLARLPEKVRKRFEDLAQVLRAGPTAPYAFQNYSPLGDGGYHCHLGYRHVACWRCEKGTIIIEVYYVGSREDAPY